MIKYFSPWKEEVYGKIRGDKTKAGFKVYFSEAKLLETEEGYILYGWFTGYEGVEKAYKPEEGMQAGLCVLPIYSKTYEVRQKGKDGKYESVKFEPSVFEKWLCDEIKANPDSWMPEGKAIGGNITFTPDSGVAVLPDNVKPQVFRQSFDFETVESTDKVPEYVPKTPQRKGSGGYGSRGISLEEKTAFLKKELAGAVNLKDMPEDVSIAQLVAGAVEYYKDNEKFLVVYFDLLKAIVGT